MKNLETIKENIGNIEPLVLPTQLPSEESESESEYDEDEVSTHELRHDSTDNHDNAVIGSESVNHPSVGGLEHLCGKTESMKDVTKVWLILSELSLLMSFLITFSKILKPFTVNFGQKWGEKNEVCMCFVFHKNISLSLSY